MSRVKTFVKEDPELIAIMAIVVVFAVSIFFVLR